MEPRIAVLRLLTLAWAVQIFWLSTGTFSSHNSGTLVAYLAAVFNVYPSPSAVQTLNVIMRKSAHLAEYAVLSILLYVSCQRRMALRWRRVSACWCMVATALYALSDEYHQSFVPGRGASFLDCGLDTMGGALGILSIYLGIGLLQLSNEPTRTR